MRKFEPTEVTPSQSVVDAISLVDGARLLDSAQFRLTRYVKMSPAASAALAAFELHTHLAPDLGIVAYAHIYSASKGCGKTVLMAAMRMGCADPLSVGDTSVAYIARSLRNPRTLFIDELDAIFRGDKDRAQLLRGILNNGNRKGAMYGRCEPPRYEPVDFPVYGPKVFAGIGRDNLPDTLRDRSIPICLERMLPSDEVEPLFEYTSRAESDAQRERTKGWAQANGDAVISRISQLYANRREESVLVQLSTHAFEAWVPLVAICDLAGGDWPRRIRQAANELMLGEDAEDRSHLERLLANAYDVFEGNDFVVPTGDSDKAERISSVDFAHRLKANDEWEWDDWNRRSKDKGITPRQIAALLKEFRIRPKSIRIGKDTFKGYEREQFEKVWKAYRIPANASTATCDQSHRSQPDNQGSLKRVLDRSQTPNVTDMKLASNPDGANDVTDVTAADHAKANEGAFEIGGYRFHKRESGIFEVSGNGRIWNTSDPMAFVRQRQAPELEASADYWLGRFEAEPGLDDDSHL